MFPLDSSHKNCKWIITPWSVGGVGVGMTPSEAAAAGEIEGPNHTPNCGRGDSMGPYGPTDFMGTYDGMTETRNLGLAIRVRFRNKLYPFDVLTKQPLVHDRFQGRPVLVVYAKEDRTATAWGALMSGSGSAVFGIFENLAAGYHIGQN